ncbi:MAG: hypothetical protein ACLRMJ_08675 [Alistipes finegoldii]
MTVPFKTQEPVVINTVYRIDVSDGRYGANTSAFRRTIWVTSTVSSASRIDTYDDDAAFMKSRIDITRGPTGMNWRAALTWADLTFTETQTVVAPAYIEEAGATRMGLVDDTSTMSCLLLHRRQCHLAVVEGSLQDRKIHPFRGVRSKSPPRSSVRT